jgi:hypothetical protein
VLGGAPPLKLLPDKGCIAFAFAFAFAFDLDLDLDLKRPVKPRRPESDVAAWGEPAGMPV